MKPVSLVTLLFLGMLLIPAVSQARYGYAVGTDIYGSEKCFPADRYGNTFGYSVDDSLCAENYLAGKDIYGSMKCFPADENGNTFGLSVEDRMCAVDYRVGRDIYGSAKCFSVDANGVIYGLSVDDSYCMSGGYYRPHRDVYVEIPQRRHHRPRHGRHHR